MRKLSYGIVSEQDGTILDLFERGLSFRMFMDAGSWPPLDVLNDFLVCGVDDMEAEQSLVWTPFSLSQQEYLAVQSHFRQRGKIVRIVDFDVTEPDYKKWFGALVCALETNAKTIP